MHQNTNREATLLAIYNECNEHAREQAKMRNGMMTIYLALFAAYAGLVNGERPLSEIIFYGLVGAMLILGWLCARAVIDYRCWIIRYLSCARAISSLLMQDMICGSAADISEILRKHMKRATSEKKHMFARMGNLVVIFFIIITSTPIVFLADRMKMISGEVKILISIIYIIIYSAIQIRTLAYQVKMADNEGGEGKYHKLPWIIDFH